MDIPMCVFVCVSVCVCVCVPACVRACVRACVCVCVCVCVCLCVYVCVRSRFCQSYDTLVALALAVCVAVHRDPMAKQKRRWKLGILKPLPTSPIDLSADLARIMTMTADQTAPTTTPTTVIDLTKDADDHATTTTPSTEDQTTTTSMKENDAAHEYHMFIIRLASLE